MGRVNSACLLISERTNPLSGIDYDVRYVSENYRRPHLLCIIILCKRGDTHAHTQTRLSVTLNTACVCTCYSLGIHIFRSLSFFFRLILLVRIYGRYYIYIYI